MVVEVGSFGSRNNRPHIKSIHIRLPFEGGKPRANRLEVASIVRPCKRNLHII